MLRRVEVVYQIKGPDALLASPFAGLTASRTTCHTLGFAVMADDKKTVLVVSAHAADFVWRAGGAIALYADRGYRVRIICLSFGERGNRRGFGRFLE
jgi:hypothetical protein